MSGRDSLVREGCECRFCQGVRFNRETNHRLTGEDFVYYKLVPGLFLVAACVVWMTVMFK